MPSISTDTFPQRNVDNNKYYSPQDGGDYDLDYPGDMIEDDEAPTTASSHEDVSSQGSPQVAPLYHYRSLHSATSSSSPPPSRKSAQLYLTTKSTFSYEDEKLLGSLQDRFPFLNDERKRTRKLLTPEQTRVLEAVLEKTIYPSTPLREAIARQLSIPPRKVQIWFQNKRQGRRRLPGNEDHRSSLSHHPVIQHRHSSAYTGFPSSHKKETTLQKMPLVFPFQHRRYSDSSSNQTGVQVNDRSHSLGDAKVQCTQQQNLPFSFNNLSQLATVPTNKRDQETREDHPRLLSAFTRKFDAAANLESSPLSSALSPAMTSYYDGDRTLMRPWTSSSNGSKSCDYHHRGNRSSNNEAYRMGHQWSFNAVSPLSSPSSRQTPSVFSPQCGDSRSSYFIRGEEEDDLQLAPIKFHDSESGSVDKRCEVLPGISHLIRA